MKKFFHLLLVVFLILSACNDQQKASVLKDKYESSKLTLEQIEKKSTVQFLQVSGSKKKNLIGQTVVRGTIVSNAKVISYKDIDVKISFYSKTGALLEEDHEVVYEIIKPGGSTSFKSKYFAPKGTTSVLFKVVGALSVEDK